MHVVCLCDTNILSVVTLDIPYHTNLCYITKHVDCV